MIIKKLTKELKRLCKDIFPPVLLKIYNIILKNIINNIISSPDFKKKINNWGVQNKQIKCSIICNGPSLKKSLVENADFIKSNVKISVNFMPLYDDFFDLKPEFLVLVDPIFWSNDNKKILEDKINKLNQRLQEIEWKLDIIMPKVSQQNNRIINKIKSKNNINIIYINSEETKTEKYSEMIYHFILNKSVPNFQNVNVAAIYFALNIGFKEIYLFGCDHDWIKNIVVKNDSKLYLKDIHFYKDSHEENYNKIDSNLEYQFKSIYTLHNSYSKLNKYSNYLNAKIYNAAEESMIDEFEKIKL